MDYGKDKKKGLLVSIALGPKKKGAEGSEDKSDEGPTDDERFEAAFEDFEKSEGTKDRASAMKTLINMCKG